MLAILLLSSFILSSCAHKISVCDTPTVNGGVDYLWRSEDSISVRPGMKLVIHALPLRGPGFNDAPPAPTIYEWTVPPPGAPLDRKDVLFANFLAVSGQPTSDVPASVEADLAGRAEQLCANGACPDETVGRKYFDTILTPLFSTLRVKYFHRWTQPEAKNTVAALRRKACEPSAKVLEQPWDANTAATGALVYTYRFKSTPFHYEVLGSGDWFLRGDRITFIPDPDASAWYTSQSTVWHTRGFTEIQIPVRVRDAATSIYLPVCTSVADAEERLGQPVVAVRRSVAFLPKDADGKPVLKAKARRGYFTIWLDGRDTGWDVVGSADLKPLLMLGAGDVLVMGCCRTRPSDVPVPTWQQH